MMEVDQHNEEVQHPLVEKAQECMDKGQDQQAIPLLEEMILLDDPEELYPKLKENCIYQVAGLYAKLSMGTKLSDLIVNIRPFFASIPKARTAKIVRSLIDMVGKIPGSRTLQIGLCKESIEWCKKEKRTFLRQRIESKLASLLLEEKEFKVALALVSDLTREVKKIDDKLLLVEIHLVESRIHLALKNVPKSKAALTASRAASNAIYCPPALQAEIDELSGTLCSEENDYKTSFSYFYEAFESYSTVSDEVSAVRMLKYMLLTKIMTNSPGEVFSLISGKAGVKHAGVDLEAMKTVAEAYKKRSLQAFEDALATYRTQLQEDPIIASQLSSLYENLLEQNLNRIIEPFSRVETAHIAKLIDLPVHQVEGKLSEMILDNKLNGILDQGTGCLIVFDESRPDETYTASLETLKELSNVVNRLYTKANRLGA